MFRGYADYMETNDFQGAVEELLKIALTQETVIMCAELLWWHCHRSLIADYLKVRGIEVVHIIDLHKSILHPFTSATDISEDHLSYESTDHKSLKTFISEKLHRFSGWRGKTISDFGPLCMKFHVHQYVHKYVHQNHHGALESDSLEAIHFVKLLK
jgi:hypothetical protein